VADGKIRERVGKGWEWKIYCFGKLAVRRDIKNV
jgi:hypothetical protein